MKKALSDPVVALHILLSAAYGEPLGGTYRQRQELVRLGWLLRHDSYPTPEGEAALETALQVAAQSLVDNARTVR